MRKIEVLLFPHRPRPRRLRELAHSQGTTLAQPDNPNLKRRHPEQDGHLATLHKAEDDPVVARRYVERSA